MFDVSLIKWCVTLPRTNVVKIKNNTVYTHHNRKSLFIVLLNLSIRCRYKYAFTDDQTFGVMIQDNSQNKNKQ